MDLRGKIFAVAVSACLAYSASADVVTLSNGDRLTGAVLKTSGDFTLVQTQYGTVKVPSNFVTSIAPESSVAAAIKSVEPAQNVAAEKENEAMVSAMDDNPAIADPAAPVPDVREPEWLTDYKNFIKQNFPEGWQFRLRGGLDYRKTTSSVFAVSANFDVVKEWGGINKFTATAYYLYTTETSVSDVTSTTLDKYGFDTAYRRQFDEVTNWYMQNLLSYRRDCVKGISDQVDEAIVVGYRFDFKRYNLTIDIAPGPAIRYVNADNYDQHWAAMAVLSEDITWKISNLLRFEENGYLGFSVTNPSKYSGYLKLGLVLHADEAMDIALRYSYEYDAINADTAQKTEQRLMLSFEFPFNWKY